MFIYYLRSLPTVPFATIARMPEALRKSNSTQHPFGRAARVLSPTSLFLHCRVTSTRQLSGTLRPLTLYCCFQLLPSKASLPACSKVSAACPDWLSRRKWNERAHAQPLVLRLCYLSIVCATEHVYKFLLLLLVFA